MSKFSKIFNKYNRVVGRIGGDTQFNIYRPSYTVFDQSGLSNQIAGPKTFRLDVKGNNFAEPEVKGAFYYDVFGDRKTFQSGDVIIPVNTGTIGAPVNITITHVYHLKAAVGLMTDRLGYITEDLTTILYTNIRFSWLNPERPGPGLNPLADGDTQVSPKRKAAMYQRQNIGMNPVIIKGMRLVEITNDRNYIWIIEDIQTYSLVTVLTLVEDT